MTLIQILACTLIGFIPFLIYKYILHPAFLSPLSKIPSAHFTSPFSNGWIQWQRLCGRENRAIHNAHQNLGPVVRLGKTELSVNSVEGIKLVYSDGFDKHEWYSRAFDNYGLAKLTFIPYTILTLTSGYRTCFLWFQGDPTRSGGACS
jgi:hypothetical protein